MVRQIVIFLLVMVLTATSVIAVGERIKGRILGETCVRKGKIGECYLKWANPMVFWTEEGDTYRIVLLGEGLDQVSLDKAFGREVMMEGWVTDEAIKVTKMTVLNPAKKKEFFKG